MNSKRQNSTIETDELSRQVSGIDLEDASMLTPTNASVSIEGSDPATTPPDETAIAAPDDFFSLSEMTPLSSIDSSTNPVPISSPSSTALSTVSSSFQKGFREARHYGGGLLYHPIESTKHFSILRHSNGLVFYQGSATSVTMSIFADAPLPPDRTLWLQSKGWSGNAGMRARAFVGRNGYWLDVTPTTRAKAEQLEPDDERAWQRDIEKFKKKADKKVRETHIVRETVYVRIPVEAGDGYFRLVLCTGPKKKVLCPSPVFRVLSTSASPSKIKGAGLTQLPLELGAMVLTTAAKITTVHAVAPATLLVSGLVQPYMPSSLVQHAATKAYSVSKVGGRVEDANLAYDKLRDTHFAQLDGVESTPDSGPKAPYPLRFLASVDPATEDDMDMFDMPMLSLSSISETILHRLDGYYFGWAQIASEDDQSVPPESVTWYQAIISALQMSPTQLVRLKVTHSKYKRVTLTLLDATEDTSFNGRKFNIQIMGFIRPPTTVPIGTDAEVESDVEMVGAINDVAIAQASLTRPAWGPEQLPEVADVGKSGRFNKVKAHYTESRLAVQRQVDRVPFRKAGVRVGVDKLRDKAVGTGGIYIVR